MRVPALSQTGRLDLRRFKVKGNGVFDDGPGINDWLAATQDIGAREAELTPPPGGLWNAATPLELTGTGGNDSPNTFRLIGQRAASPIQISLDSTQDFLTVATQGEWWNVIIEGLCTVTSDLSQSRPDCRSLFAASNSGPARMTFRDIQNTGTWCYRSGFQLTDGNFTIENFSDGAGVYFGADYAPVIVCDGASLVEIDQFYIFWQGAWRGTSLANGSSLTPFKIIPMDVSEYNGNHQGTRFFAKNVWVGSRNLQLLSCVGSATKKAKSIEIEDFYFNVGGNDMLYADHAGRLELRRGTIANTANVKIDIGPGGMDVVRLIDLDQTPNEGGTLEVDVDITTGLVELENTAVDTVAQTSNFAPAPGPIIAPIYSTLVGIRARYVNAGAAIPANTLVKPNGSGSYIKLADADDGALATGVSAAAAAGVNSVFRSQELRGQLLTFATDGTAIAEGAKIYASAVAGHGGQVSAVAVGKQVGVAVSAASGGLVTAISV